jgi:hypothetical protein
MFNIKNTKPKSRSLLFLSIFAALGAIFILLPPQVEAGSPALQGILDKITSDCKDMNKNGSTWKTCEGYQADLFIAADCTLKMFEEKGGKWGPKTSAVEDCQKKINNTAAVTKRNQDYLTFIKNNCTDVDDQAFGNCEVRQNNLKPIGCSGTMFEKVDDSSFLERNNWSYKQGAVDACQKIINDIGTTPATNPGDGRSTTGGAPGSNSTTSNPDCDMTFNSPLSWIICPVVDLGANFTDWVYDNFVRGLLEEVPIKADAEDGGYRAWQQFRILGNVLLIASMLAIVYAQVRGDR